MTSQITHPLPKGTKVVVNIYCKSCFVGRTPPKNHQKTRIRDYTLDIEKGGFIYTISEGLKFAQDEIIEIWE